jgi:predicted restriction endonuclease
MPRSPNWLGELIGILESLGGTGSLSQIYAQVIDRDKMDISSEHWRSRVRDTLEKHSSDSAIFNRVDDVFYSVAGIGHGRWGLRSRLRSTPRAVDIEETDSPERSKQEIYRILRDTQISREVKGWYDSKCQICSQVIVLRDGTKYAEAHHIKPLGRPHNGPDIRSNVLCVCPTCHVKLDYGIILLAVSKLQLHRSHAVSQEFVAYHNRQICSE